MKTILSILLLSSFQLTFAQPRKTYNTYKSLKYNYTIEYPSNFNKMEIVGKNIDLKVADSKGNSIIAIVKELLPQEKNMTSDDMFKIPNELWEKNIQLPNIKVIKKGSVYVDSQKGFYLHYTSKDISKPTILYFTNYFFYYKGYLYHLTATCDINDLSSMQPIFFRALQSFTFP